MLVLRRGPAFAAAAEEGAEHEPSFERPFVLSRVHDVVLLDDRPAIDPQPCLAVTLTGVVHHDLEIDFHPTAAREGEAAAADAKAILAFLVVDLLVELALAVLSQHEATAPAVLAADLLAAGGGLAGLEHRPLAAFGYRQSDFEGK